MPFGYRSRARGSFASAAYAYAAKHSADYGLVDAERQQIKERTQGAGYLIPSLEFNYCVARVAVVATGSAVERIAPRNFWRSASGAFDT